MPIKVQEGHCLVVCHIAGTEFLFNEVLCEYFQLLGRENIYQTHITTNRFT